ncbi:MAG: DUF4089 domain-containing protein [Cyanobacteria bacterium P01_H01_bin.119]
MAESFFEAESYVEQMAIALALAIPPDAKPGVVENVAQIHQIAQQVLDFPLANDLEAGPTFQP